MYDFSVTFDGSGTQKIYDPNFNLSKKVPGFRVRPNLGAGASVADVAAAYAALAITYRYNPVVAPGSPFPLSDQVINPDGPSFYGTYGGSNPLLTGGVVGVEYIFDVMLDANDRLVPSQSYANGMTPSGGGGGGGTVVETLEGPFALDGAVPAGPTAGVSLDGASAVQVSVDAGVGNTINAVGSNPALPTGFKAYIFISPLWVRIPDLDRFFTEAGNRVDAFAALANLTPSGRFAARPTNMAVTGGGTTAGIIYQTTYH